MEQEISQTSFTRQAAKASWIVPFVALGAIIVSNAAFSVSDSPTSSMIVVVVAVFLLFMGIVLGIIGLFGGKKHGAKATILPGIVGIILNGALLSTLVFLTFSAYQNARTNRVAKEIGYGTFTGTTYHNAYFDMTITIPADWDIQDAESQKQIMDTGTEMLGGDDKARQAALKASELQTLNLFMAFQHPRGTPVDFNPSIVCLAEKVGHLTGIQKGEDYLFHARKFLESEAQPPEFPKEIYSAQLGNLPFDILFIERTFVGMTVQQEYYSAIIDGYALNLIISFTNEEEKNTLLGVLDTLTFEQG